MPLYEYECQACGHRFEKIQKFSDALESVCPVCGGLVRKLMSSPAIQFKGSGFYITDYARKDAAGGASKGDAAKSEGGKASESSSGSTPTESASGSGTKTESPKSDAGSTKSAAKPT
ncbi:MAG: hypothetical protein IT176_15975 [Acidobacteria bacterium]|nr:hypothetical protein [Acidobacteriota bacterium]